MHYLNLFFFLQRESGVEIVHKLFNAHWILNLIEFQTQLYVFSNVNYSSLFLCPILYINSEDVAIYSYLV